jgi:hypothetical protein
VSNKNKHNSIVFLTTLSVYLGLVLVGATPQISAQNLNKSDELNKISILVPGEGYVFTFNLNPVIRVNSLANSESLPIKMSGKLISLHQKFTNWEITDTKGSQKVIDFLNKEFFTPAELDPPTLPLIAEELFQSVEVDKDFITITENTKFSDVKSADRMANIFRRMIEYAKSPAADKKVAGNLILINKQVRSENNQVFIVTRLPRGSLVELSKNAKAKSK